MDKAIEEILKTYEAFFERYDDAEIGTIMIRARKILEATPEVVKTALVNLAGNWSSDDMILMSGIIDYIEVLAHELSRKMDIAIECIEHGIRVLKRP